MQARVYSEDMQYTDADPLDSTTPTPRPAAFARDAAVNPAPNGAVCPPSASAPAVGPSDTGAVVHKPFTLSFGRWMPCACNSTIGPLPAPKMPGGLGLVRA